MYLMPFYIAFYLFQMIWWGGVWIASRCFQRGRTWRSMADRVFPQQRLLASSVPSKVEEDKALSDSTTPDSASDKEDSERRAASNNPYDEAFGHRDYTLASFHTREGDGFKIVFHFQVKKHLIRRVVWLDFNRLVKRMGRDAAWAMRARLGQAQMRFSVSGPAHPWGRLELPDAWLVIGSSREGKARSFMLDTLDAVNQLIEAGGMDLVSGHHESLPVGDPKPEYTAASPSSKGEKRSRKKANQSDPGKTQADLALLANEDGSSTSKPKAALPGVDPADDHQGLPPGVTPEYVCTGILAATGFTERTDSAGRHYRIFYADVDTGSGKLNRQTGTDLERALHLVKAEVGMRVRLQHLGHVPVNGGRYRRKVWQAAVLAG